MEYRDWEILKVLYQQKNITKTADTLFISQPALTNRLKQIQEEFGVKIINPVRRGIEFTAEGEYLAQNALRVLEHYQSVKETLAEIGKKPAGILRIGASSFFTKYKLGPILKKFQSAYPAVEFHILTGWSSEIVKSLYNQDIHIGFVRGDFQWEGKKQHLFEETMLVASVNKIHLSNLPYESRIEYQTDSHLKNIIGDWWKAHYSEAPSISMEVDDVETCKDMVVNGIGYGILPSEILKDTDNLYKIEITNREGERINRETWMYYNEESLEITSVKAFVDFIEAGNW
ncbi:LysR family transcriptional regulator [Domibacillus robiginosus]|uniref:LysR family transcriptional regulator n=1 Tax=Domibacillus robiginosus TaxID=1071054 RepID=UPI00067E0953|nr:LysR family transcriptional regulator [Domibacillus robiginosus]